MYQNLDAISEAEAAFRQAIDSVGDAEQREQLRQAYIQVETQARTHGWYRFAQHGTDQFLSTAIKLGQTALVKFFFTGYDWERWFHVLPELDNILLDIIASGNLELLSWLPNESPARLRDQCWLDLPFYGAVKTAIDCAQLAVVKHLCETCKQEWQKDYTNHGG